MVEQNISPHKGQNFSGAFFHEEVHVIKKHSFRTKKQGTIANVSKSFWDKDKCWSPNQIE